MEKYIIKIIIIIWKNKWEETWEKVEANYGQNLIVNNS